MSFLRHLLVFVTSFRPIFVATKVREVETCEFRPAGLNGCHDWNHETRDVHPPRLFLLFLPLHFEFLSLLSLAF